MLRSKKTKVNGLLLGIVVCLLAMTLIGVRLNVFGYNSADSITQQEDAKERELLPPVIMPEVKIKLTSAPNCSIYVHTLAWRNTLDYDKTPNDNVNDDYADVNPLLRLGIYIRDIDEDGVASDDLTPVTQIPLDGKAKQKLLLPSKHSWDDFIQEIYNDARDTDQRTIKTKHNYLFSLKNADDDLWDDIEAGNKEFIFKVLGHYRRDNTYIDWQKQSKKHPKKEFRQYYQDLIDYQDHKDDKNAEKLRIFYDPSDSLDHLDFYNLKKSDCSEEAETSLLPNDWLEMTIADRIKLNPYKCSSPSKMQNNGRCIVKTSTKTNEKAKKVKFKISAEEIIAKDKLSAEYRIKLKSPEDFDASQVKIQYKVITKKDKCNSRASWNENIQHRGRMGMDIEFDRWRDKPRYFVLTENKLYGMTGSKLCFKASKTADSKYTYTSGYAEVNIRSWRVICMYFYGIWKICFTIE